jgi:hypothetical protein
MANGCRRACRGRMRSYGRPTLMKSAKIRWASNFVVAALFVAPLLGEAQRGRYEIRTIVVDAGHLSCTTARRARSPIFIGVVTHRGATQVSDEQGEARALEMASRFGHRRETLRVLRTASFDGGVAQRVDVKTLQLAPEGPAKSRRPTKSAARKRQSTASRRKR